MRRARNALDARRLLFLQMLKETSGNLQFGARLSPRWDCSVCLHACVCVFAEVDAETRRFASRPWKDSCSRPPRTLNGRAVRKHGIRDSRNYKCASKRRALKWKMPASRIVERNGKINIYFSAEEKMSSVSERDGKFISAPAGAGSSAGRVPKRRRDLWAFTKSPLSFSSVL